MLLETLRNLKFYLTTRANDEKGVTAVEYAIMVAIVAIVVATAAPDIGSAVNSVFQTAIDEMS